MRTFQNLRVLSSLSDASVSPSGENPTGPLSMALADVEEFSAPGVPQTDCTRPQERRDGPMR